MEQLISHGMHECRSACHELVVVRILVFAPMSVDAYLLDADDWAIFHASTRAAAANAHGGLLSVHLSYRLAQARTGETRASPSGASASRAHSRRIAQVFDQKWSHGPKKISR